MWREAASAYPPPLRSAVVRHPGGQHRTRTGEWSAGPEGSRKLSQSTRTKAFAVGSDRDRRLGDTSHQHWLHSTRQTSALLLSSVPTQGQARCPSDRWMAGPRGRHGSHPWLEAGGPTHHTVRSLHLCVFFSSFLSFLPPLLFFFFFKENYLLWWGLRVEGGGTWDGRHINSHFLKKCNCK